MARFVRFASEAERRVTALRPDALRRLVMDRIMAIAEVPSPVDAEDFRLVAWAGSSSSGLVLSIVVYGPHAVLVVYRIRTDRDEIWIQDVVPLRGE
jgi:hypothetical protein